MPNTFQQFQFEKAQETLKKLFDEANGHADGVISDMANEIDRFSKEWEDAITTMESAKAVRGHIGRLRVILGDYSENSG